MSASEPTCLHDMTKRTFPQTREGSFMKCKICKMAKNGAGDGVPGAGGTCLAPTEAKRRPNRRFDSHHRHTLQKGKKIERVMGIEPTYPAWKAGVLPLNYTRIIIFYYEAEAFRKCLVPESNQRHKDFQSSALPTELTRLVVTQRSYYIRKTASLSTIFSKIFCKSFCRFST